jgi:glycosyltransferase involved in cell wall biosynthesis
LSDLSDSELAFLYDKCIVNIVPSLFEGFGLSTLEAMKRGKFSICHSGTATSEIVGSSGLAIDMTAAREIRDALCLVCEDLQLVNEKNLLARVRGQDFSWTIACHKLMSLYGEILRD